MKKSLLLSLVFFAVLQIATSQPINIYWTSAHGPDTVNLYYQKDTALKLTATDLKQNLTKATGLTFDVLPMPANLPSTGILLIADTNYTTSNLQKCTISGNGTDLLSFTSKFSHGVNYGVYEFLYEQGFRFYLPDTTWEVIPTISTPFVSINKSVEPKMSFRDPILTNGLGVYPTDSNLTAKKAWLQWIDRNNMLGEYIIAGHNDWSQDIRTKMNAIPCSIAEHDSSLATNQGNIPNVTNQLAMDTWGSWMASNWIYIDAVHKYNPYVTTIKSIDLPDGTIYGNTNYFGCAPSGYPSASDQRFLLENRVTEIMQDSIPGAQTWCLSYDAAADTPSVAIHPNLNVSVTMGFQFETSNISLMNRWIKKMQDDSKLSEYNYLNLPGGGQYPYTSFNYFKNAYNRMKINGSDGSLNELGLSKFSTGIHLYAINNFAKNYKDMETSRIEFVSDMFGASATPIKELFDLWINDNANTVGPYVYDNKHKYPKYLQLLQTADGLASGKEKLRVKELKAYLHYMILNDKLMLSDSADRRATAEVLATYIAKMAPLKIINTYASLTILANDEKLYLWDSTFYHKWLPNQSWTSWNPGVSGSIDPIWKTITPITESEIDANFANDVASHPTFTNNYAYTDVVSIVNQISANGLQAKDTVNFNLDIDAYYTTIAFSIYAPAGGSIKIIYDSLGFKPNKTKNTSAIFNFSIDSEDQLYSTEQRINTANGTSGQFELIIPAAGKYDFLISKPTYGGGQFKFVTNGNVMYRSGAIYPTIFETNKNMNEAASYVYVPTGVDKIYMSMVNACTKKTCVDTAILNQDYLAKYRSPNKDTVYLHKTADSSLYYLPVANGEDGKFWQIYHSNSNAFSMSLSAISNFYFWLEPVKPIGVNKIDKPDFKIYPNPNNGRFAIKLDAQGVVSVGVFTGLGQNCYQQQFDKWGGTSTIDLSTLPNGIYTIKIENNGMISSKRILISK